jgi:predicted AlkP superfamily phosphohydrolase/phosphomutase
METFGTRQFIVVGLDGTRLDTLQYLAQQGHMPNVARVLSEGTFGQLRSVLPPFSAPAWVSMATGANPGKHSIYDFYQRDPRLGRRVPVNATHLSARTVWDLLGEAGHAVAVINVPITYPPYPVNGVLISDFLVTPEGQADYAYPHEVRDEIERLWPDFHPAPFRAPSRTLSFVQQVIEWTEKAEQVCRWIAENHPATFLMNVFQATDIIQHYFFDYLQPARLQDEMEPLTAALLDLYQRLDDIIGSRLQMMDDDTLLLLVSDHGFTSRERSFYLNHWLKEQGFLILRKPRLHQRLLDRFGLSQRQLVRLLQRIDILGLMDRLPLETRRQMGARLDHAMGGKIDWERTLAYAGAISSQAVYVTERGDAALLSELIDKLAEVRDPATGVQIFEEIYRREELYSGPHLHAAPQLVYQPVPGYMVDDKVSVASTFDDALPSAGTGQHHPDGFYALFGPEIVSPGQRLDAEIVDIAPTILHLMGQPVPHSMDGEVLAAALEPQFLVAEPVRYTEASHLVDEHHQEVYSPEDEEVIRQRLQDLGYLG